MIGSIDWGGVGVCGGRGWVGGWPYLSFAQNFLDHMTCTACMAGCGVLHASTGVANRVKVIRLAGAGL